MLTIKSINFLDFKYNHIYSVLFPSMTVADHQTAIFPATLYSLFRFSHTPFQMEHPKLEFYREYEKYIFHIIDLIGN